MTMRGVRVSIYGFGAAIAGWLVAVFIHGASGTFLGVTGIIVGGIGVVLVNVGKRQSHG